MSSCPYLCGLCKKGSVITTLPTTTVTQTTTSTRCQQIACQNSGVYDSSSCICSCPLGFLGTACELYNCASSTSDPVECSLVDCSYSGAKGVSDFYWEKKFK